jgi:hypothetical protein
MSSTDKKDLKDIIKALEKIDLDDPIRGYQSPATQLGYIEQRLSSLQKSVAISEAVKYELSLRERPTIDIVCPWLSSKETNCQDLNYAMKRARDLTLWRMRSVYPKEVDPAYILIFDKHTLTWNTARPDPISEKELGDAVRKDAAYKEEQKRTRDREEDERHKKDELIRELRQQIKDLENNKAKQKQYIESLLKAVSNGELL